MTNIALKLKELVVGFPGKSLSTPLTLELPHGSSLGIIGGNGSGKTTLLKTILGFIRPKEGSFRWEKGAHFGYIPQENEIDELFPLTVLDLLKMGQGQKFLPWGSSAKLLKERVPEMLKEMNIEHLRRSLFRELSGGQKQRTLLGRALIDRPNVLLLDEPFISLDYSFEKKFWDFLKEHQKKLGLTLIIIEHDINRIINHVDYAILLGPHQSFAGKTSTLIDEKTLSEAFEAPLHIHEEDGNLQIHFL